MRKFINNPHLVVEDALSGILKAYPKHLKRAANSPRVLVRQDFPISGKVAIVTGGGSGHLPVFLGYLGEGLADAAAIGNVFSTPPAEDILVATEATNTDRGVMYLLGNYMGDVMAFGMAAEMAQERGIAIEIVTVTDDVISAPSNEVQRRRGIAGIFFAYKIAGAKAETGASLSEVTAITRRAVANTRSMGVALSPCVIPAVGRPNFSIAEDEMALGMGIHGEPGLEQTKLKSAAEIAEIMVDRVVSDLPFQPEDRVAVLVNGLGATPLEELFTIFDRAHDVLVGHGLTICRTFVGEYATSMEMAGCSVSLLRLDNELLQMLDMPAYSPFLLQSR